MKLKDTLNLGKTAFPMRAGLPTKEPVWQKEWDDAKLLPTSSRIEPRKTSFHLAWWPSIRERKYSRWTRYEQDFKRYHCSFKINVRFLRTIYPRVGTLMVCQSSKFWQNKVSNVKKWDLVEYLKLCREYALSQVDKQREDFKRLGVSGDWEIHMWLWLLTMKQPKSVYLVRWLIKVISTVVPSQLLVLVFWVSPCRSRNWISWLAFNFSLLCQ